MARFERVTLCKVWRGAVLQISNIATFLALTGLSWGCRPLPRRVAARLGRVVGVLFLYLLPETRRRVLAHLHLAYGGEKSAVEIGQIARRMFEHFGVSAVEILKFHHDPPTFVLEGEEHLRAIVEAGRGGVLVTGHIGNWELLGAELVRRGWPLHVLARALRNERMDRWLLRLRSGFGVETIQRGEEGAAWKIRRAFREGGLIACLIDQDTKVDGAFVDFFNRKAHTPTGAVRLAMRSGARLFTAFITRLPDGRHRITIDPPIEMTRTANLADDLAVNTARLTTAIESQIRRAPEQWVWMHRRWKTRPEIQATRPEQTMPIYHADPSGT